MIARIKEDEQWHIFVGKGKELDQTVESTFLLQREPFLGQDLSTIETNFPRLGQCFYHLICGNYRDTRNLTVNM